LTSAVLGASLRGACGASGSSTISGGTGVVGARGGAWVRGRLGKRRRNEEKWLENDGKMMGKWWGNVKLEFYRFRWSSIDNLFCILNLCRNTLQWTDLGNGKWWETLGGFSIAMDCGRGPKPTTSHDLMSVFCRILPNSSHNHLPRHSFVTLWHRPFVF
jgi:hypothetical protein